MGYLIAMEKLCDVIWVNALFCKVHSIDPINVCTNFEINQYKIVNLENMHKLYVLFDVT